MRLQHARFGLVLGAMVATAGSASAINMKAMMEEFLPSSHREAPAICGTPQVDATDFYMFRSYEPGRDGFVTLVANYIPFQTPYGGPTFFQMDPDALYQIHIDNDGDGREDITFSFRFQVSYQDIALNIGGRTVPVPLYNVGGIGPGAAQNANLNIRETYTVDVIRGDREHGAHSPVRDAATGSAVFRKPADFVGAKSIPNYENYARGHIFTVNLPGCPVPGRVFVGQRKDPFVANLGEIFDLVNTNPVGPVSGEANLLEDDNVTSLILEVPISYLRTEREAVIGGWTTASLPQTRVLRNHPSVEHPDIEVGRPIQVSRLGMPLVNEVVIGLPDKDRFNNSEPKDDAQFLTYVTNPTLPALLNVLFPVVTPPCLPRNDLVQAFLTGVPGLNQPAGVHPSEMLRLNTGTPVRARGLQNPLGVLGGDVAGFPNGRRPGDDVVDVSLRVVVGVLIPSAGQAGSCAPSGTLPLTDGAFINDQRFDNVFPYLTTPVATSPNTR